MGRRAGLPAIDEHVDIPTPDERLARLADGLGQRPDVSATAPVGPPPAVRPPPTLSRGLDPSSLEAQLNAAADRAITHQRRLGLAAMLPGARVAIEGEKILGANLPGRAGEYMQNLSAEDEANLAVARRAHPVLGLASDVGEIASEFELLGRVPGPVGRFFREPGIGGAPATRGLFEGGRVTGTLEREGVGTLGQRLARAGGVEGRKFGAFEAGRATLERRPPEEIVERGVAGAAGGAAFGVGGQAVTEAASPLIRSTLRGIARRNLPPMESPFLRPGALESGQPRALLAPPPEAEATTAMPEHVANAGAAQRLALELTGQAPPAPGGGQSVAPIGTDPNSPERLAGNELAQLTLKRPKTPDDLARIHVLQAIVAAQAPPPSEPHAAPATAAAAPAREIPAEPPATLFPERRAPRKPPEIRLPEGAPEVLGGEAADVGKHAAKPGEEGTLPQPRQKNFKKYDDDALEARWTQINDRLEAMAGEAGRGINVWARTQAHGATITGTTVTGAAGRALGRLKDDKRILGELEREFHARGINPRDVMDRYLERAEQLQQSAEQTAERRALETEGEGGDASFNVFEEGKPYNEAAMQEDLFGKPKLKGSLQTELLSSTAGVPTAKLKGTKLSAEEVARVKREGGEPEGERPGELPGIVREHAGASERIHAVAVRLPDGTVVRGKPGQLHPDVHRDPRVGEWSPLNDFKDGFVTSRGRFVDRKQAYRVARKAEQYTGQSTANLPKGELDAGDLSDDRVREPHRPYEPAQPMKGDKIISAAEYVGGRVYRGLHHGEAGDRAFKNAKRRGIKSSLESGQVRTIADVKEPLDTVGGFIVRRASGQEQFVDRAQALEIAHANGQLKKGMGDLAPETIADYPHEGELITESLDPSDLEDAERSEVAVPLNPPKPQEGDRITGPATVAAGRVYRGKYHHGESADAAARALKRRGPKGEQIGVDRPLTHAEAFNDPSLVHGFIVKRADGTEQFATRKQALDIARRVGLVDLGPEAKELDTEDMKQILDPYHRRNTVRDDQIRDVGLTPSPWLTQRAAVTEADAAFGGEQQMELALGRAVEQLQLKPEKPAAPPPTKTAEGKAIVAVAHYQQRADAARKIVADLKKGQASWPGRHFPNVWPEGAQPKVVIPPPKPGSVRRSVETGTEVSKVEPKYQDMIDAVGTMLQTIRSPFLETLVLFATRDDQIVASHVLTSGILGSVATVGPEGQDLTEIFVAEAKRAGATHVHSAHNHPSGQPEPSGLEADIGYFARIALTAEQAGLTPGSNLIIDDDTYTLSQLTKEAGSWVVTPKHLPYRYSPKVPWFAHPAGLKGNVGHPGDVAVIVHDLGRRHNGYLLHFNSQHVLVGVEPFTPADLDVNPKTGATAAALANIAKAAERYGAASTIIGTSDDALFQRVIELYKTSTILRRALVDVIGLRGTGTATNYKSARMDKLIDPEVSGILQSRDMIFGRRIHEPGPMAVPWSGQPGYVSDPAVLGARPIVVPQGFPEGGSRAVREGLGPGYGEDNLPNTASVIAQEAIDAAAKLGISDAAATTVGKLLTAFAGTRLEQIGGPLHLVLVEYERQRAELEELVQSDIIKESLNKSAVDFLARLPYFTEFRAVSLLAYLRDKLPKAIGGKLGVTPDRQAALFNAAEAIAEFGPDGEPVFRDVLERTGELDQVGYERLLKVYGHPSKLEFEVAQLKKSIDGIRGQMAKPSVALSPSAYAVERFKLGQRAKQTAKQGAAEQVLASLKAERNAKKGELTELKGQQALHAREGILDDDAAAAMPAEIARVARELDHLRAEISRFEGVVSGRTPTGPALDPKELPAKLKELEGKLDKWRELRGLAKEQEEIWRGRWSNLRMFRAAYEPQAAGQVRIPAAEAKTRWTALSKSEQAVVRRFATDAARAKEHGLAGHVNRELAKLEYEISSDIEAYVHHYGFEDEGAMVLWFGSALRRKKLVAGARQRRGGVEGFKRHLEGARLHGGLPLALQRLQNEFAEALERVMFTTPDPNLVRPLVAGEDPPEGFSPVLGRFGEFKGQSFAVANTIYKELEFFQKPPPSPPTTDAQANRAWDLAKTGVSRAIYYWALNQLLSVGTATRNLIGGAIQYGALVAENIAGGDFGAATRNLLALAKAMTPGAVRQVPVTEFGASQQTLRELDQAHGLFRAFMNTALIPFGMVENFFKRALTIGTRELQARRIADEMLAAGTIDQGDVDRVVMQLFDSPTFEMRGAEELVRDAFAYNYNNIPLALKRMNKSAIGKALIPFPIYGYKFARHVGRYAGAVSRLARMKGRAGDLQKALAAIILFGIPAVLTWLGDEKGKAKTTDPGSGIKYDFDRSGRVYVGKNDQGLELWLRTNSYSFYGLGAVIGHTAHDRTLTEAKNYVSEFYSVGPGFQAADYVRQMRNRYQTYRNNAAIAGDFARSWIPFHRPLETATRMVDPVRRKQETFTESMLYAIPLPEPVLNDFGLSRGEPRTAMGGAQLVPGYNPLLEFLKEFGGVNVKPINPRQAQDEYRRAAVRAQVRERRSTANSARLRRLESRQRERQP